jgi:Domain of unknown function (DUF5666)
MKHFQEFSMAIKRLLLILGVLLILLIGISIYSFAILLPNAAQTSLSTPTATPVQAVPTKISSVQRVVGTIQSIGNQTFVLALDHENKTVSVSVTAKTTYITPNGSATFSDLRVGELVEVRSNTDSLDTTTILAIRVIIKSAVA